MPCPNSLCRNHRILTSGGRVLQLLTEAQELLATMVLGNTFATAASVAHVIETEAVGDLGVEQTDDMTPRAERARLGLRIWIWLNSRDQMKAPPKNPTS